MDKRVDVYIAKQSSPQKELCQQVRDLIVKTIPSIKEEMKWGVPTYNEGACYIVALKDHINVGFDVKKLSDEDLGLLHGSGKTMKHIEIGSSDDIDEDLLVRLLKVVAK